MIDLNMYRWIKVLVGFVICLVIAVSVSHSMIRLVSGFIAAVLGVLCFVIVFHKFRRFMSDL